MIYAISTPTWFEPAAARYLDFCFSFFLRWRAQKTKNNEEEKYHSAEG
jgi:hypothetical protein